MHNRHRAALLGLLLPTVPVAGQPSPGHGHGVSVERVRLMMGTPLRVDVEAPDRHVALAATEAAFEAVAEVDALLSTWGPHSELSRVLRADTGSWVSISPALHEVLAVARDWADATEWAFTPTAGPLIDAWGIREGGRVPTAEQMEWGRLAATTPLELREFPPALRRGEVVARAGAWIDAGAFGKGEALARAKRAAEAVGAEGGLIDFGGQLVGLGRGPTESGPVGIAHPEHRDLPVAWIDLGGRSAATSSQSERSVTVDGVRVGHVIDPRSGLPVAPWGSVTVIAPEPLTADVLSTALLVMGPVRGLEWLDEREDIAALFLISGPRSLCAVWQAAPGVRLQRRGTGVRPCESAHLVSSRFEPTLRLPAGSREAGVPQ